MTTARDRMLELLRTTPLCDDCAAQRLSFTQRQQANVLGRELEAAGLVRRLRAQCAGCQASKLVNYSSGTAPPAPAPAASEPADDRPWFWEGNVQHRIVEHLRAEGWSIEQAADTASRESGTDVVARHPDGRRLWVSVKGYPEKSQHVQARHWFGGALFDLIRYRTEDPAVELAIGLPDGFSTYLNLVPRVAWAVQHLPCRIYWVTESRSVRVE